MKNIKIIAIVIVAILLQTVNEAYAQYYNCTTSTPRGQTVNMLCSGYEPLSAVQILSLNNYAEVNFPNAYRWGNASARYNCHSYAWYWSSLSNTAWMNTPNDDKYWWDASYVAATWNTSTRISYGNNTATGDHSARNYNGYIGWAHSKWGQLPRMIHWYTDAPYTGPYNLYKRR